MSGTAIVFTLYDPETNEPKHEPYRRTFIPWKLAKRAMKIASNLHMEAGSEAATMTEEDVDQITDLVVDTFGGQFTREDVENGADISEMVAVLTQIIAKVQGISANPPPAG